MIDACASFILHTNPSQPIFEVQELKFWCFFSSSSSLFFIDVGDIDKSTLAFIHSRNLVKIMRIIFEAWYLKNNNGRIFGIRNIFIRKVSSIIYLISKFKTINWFSYRHAKLIVRAIQQPIITNYVMTQIMIAKNEKISSICVRRNRQRKRGVKWHLNLTSMVFIITN